MAKKRKTTKRRNRSLSAGGGKKRRSTKRRKSSGLLSESGMAGKVKTGIKHTGSAVIGSLIGTQIAGMIPTKWGKLPKLALMVAVAVAGSAMNTPIMAAGAIGSLTASSFPKGFLNDDADFADDDVLNDDAPLFLDDDGNPMVLDDDGNGGMQYRYLDEDELEMMERSGAWSDYVEV